jgi:predicted AAA+ superfamily ATPase
LDEVQLIPQFEKLVDALYVKKDIDLYITGSNAYLLSSELSTMLSGRYIAINLHPFSFAEYVTAFPEVSDMGKLFRQYMNGSCFPESVTLSKVAPEQENIYLQSLYDTVVVKDIVQRQKLRKFDTLQRVLNFVFDSVGSVVSPNNIADTLRKNTQEPLSHNTILKYLRYFSESYLIYPVRLFNIKGKRLLASNYKYYVVDLGLKNILHTNSPAIDLGHKLENVVYFELLRRGGTVYAGRTDNGEVDFVVQHYDGTRAYYQVAYTANDEKTLKRELSSLRNIRDSYPKYLLTLDYETSNIDSMQRFHVIDWLLKQ